ncbi:hypothetical protein O6H91_09G048400 [Diphasiastrum complanatum]|uniref:Uncharacterized protein n=1 Tax=Diphasiastrum complanatum TaxID=34168 RepID=A0ACC2CP00_DIPCM|nr:hypothetical protein O6H91_09G048400 [Diphasiastrum complanatum]
MGKREKWFSTAKNSKVLSSAASKSPEFLATKSFRKVSSFTANDTSIDERRRRIIGTTFDQTEEQSKHALAVAMATAAAAEAAIAAAHAAVSVVQLTTAGRRASLYGAKSTQEWAAVKIQTAFRSYLARKDLHFLKARMKQMKGNDIRAESADSSFGCLQNVIGVQARAQKVTVPVLDRSLHVQRPFWRKNYRDAHKNHQEARGTDPYSMEERTNNTNWDNSPRSTETSQTKLNKKQEAATRRERALNYAYINQQRRPDHKQSLSISTNSTDREAENHQNSCRYEHWRTAQPLEKTELDGKVLEKTYLIKFARGNTGLSLIREAERLRRSNSSGLNSQASGIQQASRASNVGAGPLHKSSFKIKQSVDKSHSSANRTHSKQLSDSRSRHDIANNGKGISTLPATTRNPRSTESFTKNDATLATDIPRSTQTPTERMPSAISKCYSTSKDEKTRANEKIRVQQALSIKKKSSLGPSPIFPSITCCFHHSPPS